MKQAQLNGLLLPLSDRLLLLPSAAVAEVIRYQSEPEPLDNAQLGLCGQIEWRGLKLPLISFETASTSQSSVASTQFAILNVTCEQTRLKFFALQLQGHPHPILLDPALSNSEEALLPLELAAVNLADGRIGKIPNLSTLEEQLLSVGLL